MTNKDIRDNSIFLFSGLLAYQFLYYTQLAGRYPVLSPLRLEFVVGGTVLFVIFIRIFEGKISLAENKTNSAVIIFLIACVLTIPFAFVKTRALETVIQLFKFASVYIMIISCISSEKRITVLFYLYLALISLLFVEPLVLLFIGERGLRYSNYQMRLWGITGFFENPNQLGGIVSANLPFFYIMFLYHNSLVGKALFAILFILAVCAIMLTQSRTAFVGVLAFGLAVWLSTKNKIVTFILLVICAVLMWMFAPEDVTSRFMTMFRSAEIIAASDTTFAGDHELGSINSRWILFKNAMSIFWDNPFFGVGAGCFVSASGVKFNSWMETHNLYTQALSDLGIVGFMAFFYLILKIWNNCRESKRILEVNVDQTILPYINDGVSMILLIRLVIGLFGHDLYRDWWFFLAGLSVVTLRIAKDRYELASG